MAKPVTLTNPGTGGALKTIKGESLWKDAVRRHYNHTAIFNLSGSSSASRCNYLDLDPTYRDAWGLPLLRMTFDFPDNDLRMSRYVTGKASEIARRRGATKVVDQPRTGPFTTIRGAAKWVVACTP